MSWAATPELDGTSPAQQEQELLLKMSWSDLQRASSHVCKGGLIAQLRAKILHGLDSLLSGYPLPLGLACSCSPILPKEALREPTTFYNAGTYLLDNLSGFPNSSLGVLGSLGKN